MVYFYPFADELSSFIHGNQSRKSIPYDHIFRQKVYDFLPCGTCYWLNLYSLCKVIICYQQILSLFQGSVKRTQDVHSLPGKGNWLYNCRKIRGWYMYFLGIKLAVVIFCNRIQYNFEQSRPKKSHSQQFPASIPPPTCYS